MVFLEQFSTASGTWVSQVLDGLIVLGTVFGILYPTVVWLSKKLRQRANKLKTEFDAYKKETRKEIEELNDKLNNALIKIARLEGYRGINSG